jgi:peptidoglycan/LPS O-acetylase OafA/YrhL
MRATMTPNSLDALRLLAALMVLYSHQYALLGLAEPWFLGLKTFGTAGVSIFFFLSGCLVWTSWARDPHVLRFMQRRALRIFPALLVVCLVSVFILGISVSTLPWREFVASPVTWRYVGTVGIWTSKILPGFFPDNPLPYVVNGSLWTLPVELLCYASVLVCGLVFFWAKVTRGVAVVVALWLAVLIASYGALLVGAHFEPHLEMAAMFWWGAFYGYCRQSPCESWLGGLAALALLAFGMFGPQGLERTAMLGCAAALVHLAMSVPTGARLTAPFGDLSYGVYIIAFPVQQLGVNWARALNWSFSASLLFSVTATLVLAYLSWHLIEKRALRLKNRLNTAPHRH